MQLSGIKLENGLKIRFLPFKHSQAVTIHLRGKAGSNFENATNIGAAHLLEHVILNNTEKYSGQQQLKDSIENKGGHIVCATSREDVLFMTKLLKKDFELGLEFLSHIFVCPHFSDELIEKDKLIIEQEIKRVFDHPEKLIGRIAYRTLYSNQRLAKLNTGTVEDIKKLDLQKLKEFHLKNYVAKNFVLVIAGDLDKGKVIAAVQKYFKDVTPGKENKWPDFKFENKLEINVTNNEALNQAHIRVDFLGFKKDQNQKHAAEVLAKYFGDRKTSKLIKNLYNKDVFPYISSCGSFSANTYGIFGFYTACKEEQTKEVVKSIKNIILTLKTNKLTPKEIDIAKNKVLTEFLFDLEKISVYADYHSEMLLSKTPQRLPKDDLYEIKKLTSEDVYRVAQELFNQNPKITVLAKRLDKTMIRDFWYNSC